MVPRAVVSNYEGDEEFLKSAHHILLELSIYMLYANFHFPNCFLTNTQTTTCIPVIFESGITFPLFQLVLFPLASIKCIALYRCPSWHHLLFLRSKVQLPDSAALTMWLIVISKVSMLRQHHYKWCPRPRITFLPSKMHSAHKIFCLKIRGRTLSARAKAMPTLHYNKQQV